MQVIANVDKTRIAAMGFSFGGIQTADFYYFPSTEFILSPSTPLRIDSAEGLRICFARFSFFRVRNFKTTPIKICLARS